MDGLQIKGRWTICDDYRNDSTERQVSKLYSAFTAQRGSIDPIGHHADDRIDFVNQPAYRGFSLRLGIC